MGEGQSHHGGLSLHQLALQHNLQQQQQQRRQRAPSQSRVGRLRSAGGEIVEVQGGHIVRSIGRKDRHSKVCTAKGPRDRRVRLAAHTAIQFYDVQDRLGYDRPSKAVDWLIKNAKAAIDQLAELPAWKPTTVALSAGHSAAAEEPMEQSNEKQIPVDETAVTAAFSFHGSDDCGDGGSAIGILPPSLDNDSISDTIKYFFPMVAVAAAPTPAPSSPPPFGFRSYPTHILPQTSNHSEDLRLSLQSFKDPIFQHSESTHHPHNPTPSAYNLFDAVSVGWAEQNRQMPSWYGPEPSGGAGFGEFPFGVPPPHSALGLSHLVSQRGPLQSSNSPSARGWPEPGELQMHPVLLPSISSIGFASDAGLSGFCIPGRVQGQEEHGGIANKLPSASRRC